VSQVAIIIDLRTASDYRIPEVPAIDSHARAHVNVVFDHQPAVVHVPVVIELLVMGVAVTVGAE